MLHGGELRFALVQVAKQKCCRLGDLDNNKLFLMFLKAGKSKFKAFGRAKKVLGLC